MHVTLVSPYDPAPTTCQDDRAHVGGVERVFLNLSRGLAQRGHDVTLLCSTAGADGQTRTHGIRVIRRHRIGTVFGTPMVSLADHIPPDTDLVHVAATYPFTTPSVLRAARRRHLPSILDFHFEPHPASALGRLAARAYARMGPPSYALATAALVRSLSHGRSARGMSRVPESRWHVVPNGIDPHVFSPQGPARSGDYLLFVGRLVAYKGVDVLLRALATISRPPPLVIAGDGPERPMLEALATRLRIQATFLGRVPDADLPALYRGAIATVLPSVAPQESFGISLLESMACGTPVVASDLPGVAEVARVGGLVAAPSDPRSLGHQILQASAPGRLERGEPLAKRVHGDYSWDAVTRRVLHAYGHVMGPGARPRRGVTRLAHPGGRPVL